MKSLIILCALMLYTVAAVVVTAGCGEGCAQTTAVDYNYRQSRLTLHQVAPGVCVVVFHNDEGGSVDHVPCPATVTP